MTKWSEEWIKLVFKEGFYAEDMLKEAIRIVCDISMFEHVYPEDVSNPTVAKGMITINGEFDVGYCCSEWCKISFPAKFLMEDELDDAGLMEWAKEKYKDKIQKAKDKKKAAKDKSKAATEKRERTQLAKLMKRYGVQK